MKKKPNISTASPTNDHPLYACETSTKAVRKEDPEKNIWRRKEFKDRALSSSCKKKNLW